MKKVILAAAAFLMLAPAAAQAGEDLEFKLTNKSGSDIVGFYVSRSSTDNWENNLIEGGFLPDGNEIQVLINDGRSTCKYDIRTEFKDGDKTEEFGLDLCELGSYTFE